MQHNATGLHYYWYDGFRQFVNAEEIRLFIMCAAKPRFV